MIHETKKEKKERDALVRKFAKQIAQLESAKRRYLQMRKSAVEPIKVVFPNQATA